MLRTKFLVLLLLALNSTVGVTQSIDLELRAEGAKFREQVIKKYSAQSRENVERFQDLTPLCKQANFEGRTQEEVDTILQAAGGAPLIDIRTLSEQVQKANNADFLGGFNVGASGIGHTNFMMNLRVTKIRGVSVVNEITSCGVISVFL